MRSLAIGLSILPLCSLTLLGQGTDDWLSKFSVHGFVSQAFAESQDGQILGIPDEGTTDYRDLALQFRFDQDRSNIFALQIRQQRRGESLHASEDLELDWGFYQHNFTDRFTVKAGRIPLPLGIYNEAAGPVTTYPFFNTPVEFYDRQLTSKTLEGVLASSSFGRYGDWTFDVDGYLGQWTLDQWDSAEKVDARDAYGVQIWANSPWPALRFGGGAYRCTVDTGVGETTDYLLMHGSVEATFERWLLATEYLNGDLAEYGRYSAWYGQVGFQVTPRVSVHARGAVARADVSLDDHTARATISEDIGVAVNYRFDFNLVLKLEGHTNDGFLREDVPRNFYGEPSTSRYVIASVAASF